MASRLCCLTTEWKGHWLKTIMPFFSKDTGTKNRLEQLFATRLRLVEVKEQSEEGSNRSTCLKINNHLPFSQNVPFPVYPGRHVQLNIPIVSVQVASVWQLWVISEHSLTEKQKKSIPIWRRMLRSTPRELFKKFSSSDEVFLLGFTVH